MFDGDCRRKFDFSSEPVRARTNPDARTHQEACDVLVIYLAPLPRGFLFGLGTLVRFRSRLAELHFRMRLGQRISARSSASIFSRPPREGISDASTDGSRPDANV